MKRLIKKSSEEISIGDRVLFKTHPYENMIPFEVKEELDNGNFFIENEESAYTNINDINLEKLQ